MEKENIAPHVKDITRALGNKVSEANIERELNSYLTVYRVPLGTAKRSIVKKHGGNPSLLSLGAQKTIVDLTPNEFSVDLLARVVSVNEREIEVEGVSKTILYGIFGDSTGTVPFTAWEADAMDVEKGDVVKIQNAYTKEFRGEVQLNLGNRTSVEKESPDALPPYVPPERPATSVELGDLRGGMSNVSVVGRIISIESREVDVEGQKKTVFSGLIGDSTGKAQFSAWADFELREGDVAKIDGGYSKTWRGMPQLGFDHRANVEILKDTDFPSAEDIMSPVRRWIEEIAERGGAVDATVRGILIDVKEGSGLIFRCPECNRVLRKGTCRIHGEVDGAPDLRVKAVIDDGSAALTAIIGKDITEGLLGKSLEDCMDTAKEAMSHEVIRDELADLLVAQPVELRGNVTSDDYGLMMISESAEILEIDVQEEAQKLLSDLEE
ncbi:MAG: DNA-binding protein [Thermoplasmata archaeon]